MVGVEFANVNYTLTDGRFLLRDVSFALEAGTTTALLGRSGSGKTTLLRMVNGLITPTSGVVSVEGRATSGYNVVALRRSIGYVIQETGLFPHMTVERNAGLALELAGRPKAEVAARAAEVLSLVGMGSAEYWERYPWQLSGGQRQRVGLARALAADPGVLLMDEPLGALDPMTRAEMQTMVRDLFERVKKTVLLVTHDLDEALYLAQRVIFLSEGEVVADLPAREVLRSENPQVKDYVRAVHRAVSA
jgi:osmoprotectant transport system ATP-binding protein